MTAACARRWQTTVLLPPVLAAIACASGDRWNPPGQECAHPSATPAPSLRARSSASPGLSMELLPASRDEARRINAAVPMAPTPAPPAKPFHFSGDAISRARAIDCLASAEYYEAGADPAGQRAVAQVVLNRMRHPAFPATVCGVVYQGAERASGCQFTFTCDGAMARHPVPQLWEQARSIAAQALDGQVFGGVGLATHYHTDWVLPAWSGRLDKIAQVQTHLFFRWRGAWGRPASFRKAAAAEEPLIAQLAGLSPWHDPAHRTESPQLAFAPEGSAAPATTEAPPRLPAGIDLRGSELRLAHPQGDAFGFLLPPSYPGAFGLLALDVCRGRAFCKVMGWTDPRAIPAGFPIPLQARRQMAFLYVHDTDRRAEIMAWNCSLFPRRDPSECLGGELTRWDAVLAIGPEG